MLLRKKGQSTLEYAIVIGVVVAALLALNAYMKKGVQGKLKESTDQIGKQFDPNTFQNAWKSESGGTTTTNEVRDTDTGATTSTIAQGETVTRTEHGEWSEQGGATPGQHF